MSRYHAPSKTSRLVAAAGAALVTLGLLAAVTAAFHDSKSVMWAKAQSARHLAAVSAK